MSYFSVSKSQLRSVAALESAMERADFNGTELASAAGVNRQSVHKLRSGARAYVRTPAARRLEDALKVERGELFAHPDESTKEVAA